MYRILIILLLFTPALQSCHKKSPSRKSPDKRETRQILDSRLDMTGADSFRCYSATVINKGEAYTVENFPAPRIAVLNKEKQYAVVGIGRDRIVLRTTGRDTLHLKGERNRHVIKAYRNGEDMTIDSIIIWGRIGQGLAIIRYAHDQKETK